ncbi:hypothetical protein EMCRGX_G025432 [Ephydatia muelleri]|eukprot:Em0021g260a
MSLQDADVDRQIQQMKKFIEQEAKEKADEIAIKAEEEFNIEKGRLVQSEKLKISTYYERKEKQVELQRKIQRSNLLNQARLAVLKARDDNIKKILEEARKSLGEVTGDTPKYETLLESLITQCLYQLLETDVLVRCRQRDVKLVEKVFPKTVTGFKAATGKDVTLTIDTDYLPAECAGGVELTTRDGKIRVTNTLESRLELISSQLVPVIRTLLFGENESRHFTD